MKTDMTKKPVSIRTLTALVHAAQDALANKALYGATVLGVLVITVGTAASLDLLPETVVAKQAATPALIAAPPVIAEAVLPTEIEIPSLNKKFPISNPVTTNVQALDAALLTSVVRYPTSAKLGEDGNVIIFGHSSHLPIVRNDLYKAFNDIETMQKGQEIIVRGGGYEYVYAVESIAKANAEVDIIPLVVDGKKLTIATCNSFGSKDGRFIVTAELKGVRAIQ